MLRSLKDLQEYAIRATDGVIGHVKTSILTTQLRSFATSLLIPATGFQAAKC